MEVVAKVPGEEEAFEAAGIHNLKEAACVPEEGPPRRRDCLEACLWK